MAQYYNLHSVWELRMKLTAEASERMPGPIYLMPEAKEAELTLQGKMLEIGLERVFQIDGCNVYLSVLRCISVRSRDSEPHTPSVSSMSLHHCVSGCCHQSLSRVYD
jgi:hypothetical protein